MVFENFNQQYPAGLQNTHAWQNISECHSIRNPSQDVSQMVALASLKLEHLAASFMIDAEHFFRSEPFWEWPNLISLVLTSNLLIPGGNSVEILTLLKTAAATAMRMPRLETLEIWNGRKGLAALFKYQAFCDTRKAKITWRATWNLTMEPSLIKAWEAVVRYQHDDSWRLELVQEWLDEAAIMSHGDAIERLVLSGQVIRPISLQQILMEQKALEGAPTV